LAISRGIHNGGATRGLAVVADTVATAVSTVVGGTSSLSSLLGSAEPVRVARRFANLGLSVANGLSVKVTAVGCRAGRGSSTTIGGRTADGGGSTIDTLSGDLAVSTTSTNAISVQSAAGANTALANLLGGGCSSVLVETAIAVLSASLASLVKHAISTAFGSRTVLGGSFTLVTEALESINALTDGGTSRNEIALKLTTEIGGTAIVIGSASLARPVGLTISTTSARTSAVSQAGSSCKSAFSVRSASTATNSNGSIANRSSALSVRAESVGPKFSTSRSIENARSASSFPFVYETDGINILSCGIHAINVSRSKGRASSTAITDFHAQKKCGENIVHTSGREKTRGNANGTSGVGRGSSVSIFAEERTPKTILERYVGTGSTSGRSSGVVREGQPIGRNVDGRSLIATLTSTRVGTGNAKFLEVRIGGDLFSVGEADKHETRSGDLRNERVVHVVLRREPITASVTREKRVIVGVWCLRAFHASSRSVTVNSNQIAKRVRYIGKAITIICATANIGCGKTESTSRRGFTRGGPLVSCAIGASNCTFLRLGKLSNRGDRLENSLSNSDSESRSTLRSILNLNLLAISGNDSTSDSFPNVLSVMVSNHTFDRDGSFLGGAYEESFNAPRRVEVNSHPVVICLKPRLAKAHGGREGTVLVNLG
jgi:hypothetical protein